MKKLLECIQNHLSQEGYVKTYNAPELRKYKWEKENRVITILANYHITSITLLKES